MVQGASPPHPVEPAARRIVWGAGAATGALGLLAACLTVAMLISALGMNGNMRLLIFVGMLIPGLFAYALLSMSVRVLRFDAGGASRWPFLMALAGLEGLVLFGALTDGQWSFVLIAVVLIAATLGTAQLLRYAHQALRPGAGQGRS